MAAWVGPTVALSLALIAFCVVGLFVVILISLRVAQARSAQIATQLSELRKELAPALEGANAMGEAGVEIAELTRHEARELATTSAIVRREVNTGVKRARQRLDDFDALIEVLNEEVEDAALDLAVAVRTVRTTKGVIGGLRRFLVPRRRRDDE